MKVKKIIDVGCGEGQVANYLIKQNPKLEIIGVDKSNQAINLARETVKAKFFVADIFDSAKVFSKKNFDLILILEVLEHLENPRLSLKELKKINSKYYIFSVPSEPWFSLGNLLMGKNISRLGKDRDHRQFWTKKEFVDFIEVDFKISRAINNPFWTIVLATKQ